MNKILWPRINVENINQLVLQKQKSLAIINNNGKTMYVYGLHENHEILSN